MPSGIDVFLLLTDKDSAPVAETFALLKQGLHVDQQAYVLFHQKTGVKPVTYPSAATYTFTNDSLFKLAYIPIAGSLIPGSNHFPLLQFYLEHPGYDYYWVIEDDVRFNGHWKDFFDSFAQADHDFISCHVRRHTEEPGWGWWNTLIHPDIEIPLTERVRSFNPIYRLSKKALQFLHQSLSDCWIGHHEVLIPTLLLRAGFSLLDFGGTGHFVPQHLENRFYTSGTINDGKDLSEGTMRYRPAWPAVGTDLNKLYHPIKA